MAVMDGYCYYLGEYDPCRLNFVRLLAIAHLRAEDEEGERATRRDISRLYANSHFQIGCRSDGTVVQREEEVRARLWEGQRRGERNPHFDEERQP